MDDEQRKRSAQQSRIIGDIYAKWAQEQVGQFSLDPGCEDDPNYSEHPALMSASPEAEAELFRRTKVALEAAGFGPQKLKRNPSTRASGRREP